MGRVGAAEHIHVVCRRHHTWAYTHKQAAHRGRKDQRVGRPAAVVSPAVRLLRSCPTRSRRDHRHTDARAAPTVAVHSLRKAGQLVADAAAVRSAARPLHRRAKGDLLVGGEVDLSKPPVQRVEGGVERSVRALRGDLQVEVDRHHPSDNHLAHVDVTDGGGRPQVRPSAAQVGVRQVGVGEVEAERLSDAGGEGRRRRARRRRRRRRGRRRWLIRWQGWR